MTATAGDAQAQVSWTAPADDGGSAITGYTVTSSPGGLTASVAAGVTSATVTGLTNGTAYTFSVVATNAKGSSAASTASSAVTPATVPDAPTAVTASPGNQLAEISWVAPSSDGGSAVTGYTVTSDPEGLTATVSGSETRATIAGLTNGTAYTFTVVATNAVGKSAASGPSSAVTPLGVPDAPTDVVATAHDSSASVTWTAPANEGDGAVTSYTVTSTPGGLTATVSAPNVSAVVVGLTNGTSYTFRVVATSSVGDSPPSLSSTAITPTGPPDPPTNAVATAGVREATITWTASANDQGSPITRYVVQASPGGNTATVDGATTTATVTGLTAGATYTFSVYALNASGSSTPGADTNAVTLPTVPAAPTDVNATAGDGQVTVAWSGPLDDGGSAITGYTVTSSPGGITVTVAGTSELATVTGLTNGTPYTFTVVATNAVGDSAASTASNEVTPDKLGPDAPTNVVATAGNAQATVSWTAPANDNGSPVTSYTVVASPGGLSKAVTATSTDFTDLTNGTAYTFTVYATNANGDGATSVPSAAVTPVTFPGIPKDVIATRGNQSVTVNWTSPTDTGGSPITGYLVTTLDGGSPTPAGAAATSATVTGLTNGSQYAFYVHAVNDAGTGVASSRSNQVAPGSAPAMVPGPPTSVGGYASGDGAANVYWTAPTNNGGSYVTSYTVTSSPGGLSATVQAPLTWATVSGLSNGTAYTFTVKAQNGAGTSASSTGSSSITPSASPAGCSLTADTTQTGAVNQGCPMLLRDTTSCAASRTAAGLSGFWLNFSCRVTLSTTTVNGHAGVKIVSDGRPDYQSFYFGNTDPCHAFFSAAFPDPGSITTASVEVDVPQVPYGSSQPAPPGIVGVGLNGVPLFSNQAAPGDDIYLEAGSFDECQGHPNVISYHYHSEPYSITYDDAAFVGVMIDGYPIYGRRDPDGSLPDLDAYGGHTGYTVDSPNAKVYHYHLNYQISSTPGTEGMGTWFITTGDIKATQGVCVGQC